MPTYLYFCETCQSEFEHVHSIKQELEFCPTCEEKKLERVKPKRLIASGGSFVLNGGGWASEGYK